MYNFDYPEEPTISAQVKSALNGGNLLGKNELGTVHIHGSYGNDDSQINVAYNIGMHPFESKAHRALFEVLKARSDELKYKYFVYNIEVANTDDKTEGRMDGQLLAREFVAPHIIKGDYQFFVDIHSNKGLVGPGKYEKTNFIFAPGFDEESEGYMNQLLEKIPELEYYAPEYRTSPEYITIPVVESGVPTIIYETFSYEEMNRTYDLAEKLVSSVDKLEFK